jgi:hypothetical protein
MAVGIRLRFAGGTQEQYQAVHDTVNASSPLGRADGLLVHSAGPIDGGWGVIDFWESSEAFDRFTQNKLMPVIQQLRRPSFSEPAGAQGLHGPQPRAARRLSTQARRGCPRLPRLAQVT